MEMTQEIKINAQTTEEMLRAQNEEFLAKYPTDDAQIDYYTDLAMKLYAEFQIDGTYRKLGVRKNVATWFEHKQRQMNLFRKHPYWSEEAKAIIFMQTEKREINYIAAATRLWDLCNYVSENFDISRNDDAPNIVAETLSSIGENDLEQTQTISENFIEIFERKQRYYNPVPEEITRILKVGTKITKLVRKCFEMVKLNDGEVVDVTKLVDEHDPDDRTYRSFDKYYAKFADALSELTVKKITLVSLNFLDFMTMSNGNSWSSCHFINSHGIFHDDADSSYRGQYKSGCLSYALDEPSFLLYTLPATYEGNEFYRVQKLTRMCCQYQDGILITGKCYPNNSNNLIVRYRQTLQKIISQVEEYPNLWTFSRNVNRIMAFVQTDSNSTHYKDYECESQKPTISLCKNITIDLDKPMVIGHTSYCVHCGDTFYDCSWLQCRKHREVPICRHCGKVIEDDNIIEIDGYKYCSDCVFHCDVHDRYEPIDDIHGTILTRNGEITICTREFRKMRKCKDCGVYEYKGDMKTDGGKYYCTECAKKYKTCDMCGNIVVDGNETVFKRKTFCPECAKFAKAGVRTVECKEYKVGDYVLIKKDISQCKFGVTSEMSKYYPNRIVRILDIKNSWGDIVFKVTSLEPYEHYWSWGDDYFVGKILGAKKSYIGKTLEEITKEN